MKTFIQFLEESKKHPPKKHDKDHYEPAELQFGSHSVKKNHKDYEKAELKFGKHSQKPLKEEVDLLTEATVADTHKKLKAHYKFGPGAGLGLGHDLHTSAIADYTTDSRHLNKHLVKKNGKPTQHKSMIKHMDSALAKHKAPHAFEVHTGVSGNHVLHKHLNGKSKGPIKIVHHAYTSTSLNHTQAKAFAKPKPENEKSKNKYGYGLQDYHLHHHVIKIKVHKGASGAYVDHHSREAGEKEFILPRGTKLHVHPKPHTKTSRNGTIHHHTWTATIAK